MGALNSHHHLMVDELYSLCAINSGTSNTAGLQNIKSVLLSLFKPLADDIQILPLSPVTTFAMSGEPAFFRAGDALFIRKRPELARRILLVGHMDTVYPADSPFQTLEWLSETKLRGPGVADMKGGLLVMLHALQAFEASSCAQSLGWDVLINADEEVGSPASAILFEKYAPLYQAALVYEPAMDAAGTLAKNRKGSAKFTFIATGKAAHAGRAFEEGRNAICYLAEVITAIHALNGKRDGVTINMGKIAGGSALNVVPDKAVIKLDARTNTADDAAWVSEQLAGIADAYRYADYTLTLHADSCRVAKQISRGTTKLFELVKQVGSEIQQDITWQNSGGCCDGNNLAGFGLPVIDTLGVLGGNIHSPDEFILVDSLVSRANLSACLLMTLASVGGIEGLST